MRKLSVVFLMVVAGVVCSGCPIQQTTLVGANWSVDVTDTEGQVSPYDSGTILGDLSGWWYFNSDGTVEIDNDFGSVLEGTYTFDGSTVQFSASVDDSETGEGYTWSEQIEISGTLQYDGSTLQGDGTYSTAYTDSDPEYPSYSFSGSCTIDGTANSSSWSSGSDLSWLVLLLLILPFLGLLGL